MVFKHPNDGTFWCLHWTSWLENAQLNVQMATREALEQQLK
jgi:hypothetical protein